MPSLRNSPANSEGEARERLRTETMENETLDMMRGKEKKARAMIRGCARLFMFMVPMADFIGRAGAVGGTASFALCGSGGRR
jgi:hypothetical protein